MTRIEEIAAIAFGRRPSRLIVAPPLAPDMASAPQTSWAPKVSIHIPAHREPPEMLKLTLDSVARLNYPNFECVLVINNTTDPAFWRPVEEHCKTLGERFKFVREDKLEGFKAGALRLALTHTAPDAEIIGVLDADYVVHADWLKDLAPLFADPNVGLVQAPQDHRDADRSAMHVAMNGEYAGFFDIGMVQRNEHNAIVTHGTMCLMRRSALIAAGNWSSDTICEDTDLGLTILELGWTSHYTNRRYGHGLLPDGYQAYKRQRDRWAYGGFQIMKKHWRRFLPGASRLTRDQKREFLLGWMSWLGAESVGVLGGDPQPDLGAVRRHPRHRHPGQGADDPDFSRPSRSRCCTSCGSTGCACASPAARCSARCSPRWRCSGRSRARSASASSRTACRSCAPPKAGQAAVSAGAARISRRSGRRCSVHS